MEFNVLTDNQDDQAKNCSFICREGLWKLAPAYDLTLCSTGYNGEHATLVNNQGCPSIEDLLKVGEGIRIPRKKATDIIMHMFRQCDDIIAETYRTILKKM